MTATLSNKPVRETLARLWQVLDAAAHRALDLQNPDGSMPAGCNGPYGDASTPVRNTAHWLSIFMALAERYNASSYQQAAERCAAYLCSQSVRPTNRLFENRHNKAKDRWNGLIGQIWALEPLLKAGLFLNRPECSSVFCDVMQYLPFDRESGLWGLNPTSSYQRLSLTFNQQIWMASLLARATAMGHHEYLHTINLFLTSLERYTHLEKNGAFRQAITPFSEKASIRNTLTLLAPRNFHLRHHLQSLYRQLRWRRLIDLGYHAFTLFGLAQTKMIVPDHPFWNCPELDAALDTCKHVRFLEINSRNPFGNGYHLVGIEMTFSLWILGREPKAERNLQIQRYIAHDLTFFDKETAQMSINTPDAATATARLYECVPLCLALEKSIE